MSGPPYNRDLDMLRFELELAEQDLLDHDGSELDAQARIDACKRKIAELEAGDDPA